MDTYDKVPVLSIKAGLGENVNSCRVAGNTVIPRGMWVPVAVRLAANCYAQFTFTPCRYRLPQNAHEPT